MEQESDPIYNEFFHNTQATRFFNENTQAGPSSRQVRLLPEEDEESDLMYNEFLRWITEDENKIDPNGKQVGLLPEEDDDDIDPNYNFFKDILTTNVDDEDLDLIEDWSFMKDLDFGDASNILTPTSAESVSAINKLHAFSEEQIVVLKNQMALYVQILTQSFLVSLKDDTFQKERGISKAILYQLKKLRDEYITKDQKDQSVLNIPNLTPALEIIEKNELSLLESERKIHLKVNISANLRNVITSNRHVFLFDWALPSNYYNNASTDNMFFTMAEDNLIVMGLHYLRAMRNFNKTISERYLPSRTADQIKARVNNHRKKLSKIDVSKIDASTQEEKFVKWWNSPVVFYLRTGLLQPVITDFSKLDKDSYNEFRIPPKWFLKFSSPKSQKTPSSTPETAKCERFLLPKGMIPYTPFVCVKPQVFLPSKKRKYNKKDTAKNSTVDERNEETIEVETEDQKRNQNHSKSQQKFRNEFEQLVQATIQNSPLKKPDKELSVEEEREKADEETENEMETSNETSEPENLSVDMENEVEESPITPPNEESNGEEDDDEDDVEAVADDDDEDEIIYEEPEDGVEVEDDKAATDEIDDDEVEEEDEEEEEEENTDNEIYLRALMEASWTAVSNRVRRTTNNVTAVASNNETSIESETVDRDKVKAAMRALQKESSVFLVENEIASAHEENDYIPYQDSLIDYFLSRARRVFSLKDFTSLLELMAQLSSGMDKTVEERQEDCEMERVEDAYKRLTAFLENIRDSTPHKENVQVAKGVQELIDMLILFLNFSQAKNLGEEHHFMVWKRIVDFMHNVEVYLTYIHSNRATVQDSIRKMIRAINQLRQTQSNNLNLNLKRRIKLIFSKLLNGHKKLMSQFLSLFPDEPPARQLLTDSEDFEWFSIDEQENDEECVFEVAKVPLRDKDLSYGTSECACGCHGERTSQISMTSHCTSCGIRFSKSGRIYLPNNNPAKKSQFVEFVPCGDKSSMEGESDMEIEKEPTETSTTPSAKWALEEDKLLLEKCRSIVQSSHIIELDAELVKSVARSLTDGSLKGKRNFDEISARLFKLLELLIASTSGTNQMR